LLIIDYLLLIIFFVSHW